MCVVLIIRFGWDFSSSTSTFTSSTSFACFLSSVVVVVVLFWKP